MSQQTFRSQARSDYWPHCPRSSSCGTNQLPRNALFRTSSQRGGKMSGPFSLRYLHLFLREQSAGAFILSRNGTSADFVGSSPHDIADAIRQAARDCDYRYFWFATTSAAEHAYELEHGWYHRYRPTDNTSPPVPYAGIDWRCTIEGCAACALAGARST
jgi:hypothetical protein